MYANWTDEKVVKSNDTEEVSSMIEIITSIRSFKNEIGVKPGLISIFL